MWWGGPESQVGRVPWPAVTSVLACCDVTAPMFPDDRWGRPRLADWV